MRVPDGVPRSHMNPDVGGVPPAWLQGACPHSRVLTGLPELPKRTARRCGRGRGDREPDDGPRHGGRGLVGRGGEPKGWRRFAWEADTLPAELLPLGRPGPQSVQRESTTRARRWAIAARHGPIVPRSWTAPQRHKAGVTELRPVLTITERVKGALHNHQLVGRGALPATAQGSRPGSAGKGLTAEAPQRS